MNACRNVADDDCFQAFRYVLEPVGDLFVVIDLEIVIVVCEFQIDDLGSDSFTDISIDDPLRLHHDRR